MSDPRADEILLVVDIQNDFCPDGALAVPRGNEVIPVINRIADRFAHVILTQDWHPKGHNSFASSHYGRQPYDVVDVSYGKQILWPDHCVQGSHGAALQRDLNIAKAQMILRKGYHRNIDSYSAFYENDRETPTGLAGYLRERGFSKVLIAGLAFDFCVRFSAEDAIHEGFLVTVIEDACRAIDVRGSAAEARESFRRLGVTCITESEL
jgi:nicotinamidase/pyrazinamidase